MKSTIILPVLLFFTTNTFGQTWQNPSSSQSHLFFNVDGGDPSIKYDAGTGFVINSKYQETISFTDGGDTNSNLFIHGYSNRIGIGTNNPLKKLHINAVGNDGIAIGSGNALLGDNGSGVFTQLLFWNGTNAYYGRSATGSSVSNHYFRTAGIDRLMIGDNGYIGVGTINPDAHLHVYGTDAGLGNVLSSIMIGRTRGPEIQAIQEGVDADVQGLAFRVKSSAVFADPNFEAMRISRNGNVGIGTTTPDAKLAVNGNIHAKEVKVDLTGWPDYVFNKDYDLPTLKEVEKHIKEKGHLISIPSAKEVEENGIELGEMNKLLLEKIEELTLYTIQQQKTILALKRKNQEVEQLKSDMDILKKAMEALKSSHP